MEKNLSQYNQAGRITPSATSVYDALQDWLKVQISEGNRIGSDIGKFFFVVSSGTIGILTGAEKMTDTPTLSATMIFSLVVIFLSILLSILLVIPPYYELGRNSDILKMQRSQVTYARWVIGLWLLLWFIGVCSGLTAVFD